MRKLVKNCRVCGRGAGDGFLCVFCGNELRELLIGGDGERSHPGIVWYISRLEECAYRQTQLNYDASVRGSCDGYALLPDRRARELLGDILLVLTRWNMAVEALTGVTGCWGPVGETVSLAFAIAKHIKLIRRSMRNVDRMHAELTVLAKRARSIINRPVDICCGPCPTIFNEDYGPACGSVCGTLLYAELNARKVKCSRCCEEYDVDDLRENLREMVRDTLFTGPELLRLMETRLNDRTPKSTFYRLVKSGRLQARGYNAFGQPMFTYEDVRVARMPR